MSKRFRVTVPGGSSYVIEAGCVDVSHSGALCFYEEWKAGKFVGRSKTPFAIEAPGNWACVVVEPEKAENV